MIKLLKASAGSGKTFHLTKTYISLLLDAKDPNAYRHILAVTFTNKATDEMKSRILKELHILSTDPTSSDYYADFVPSKFSTAVELQNSAKVLLVNLLHDYGAFSVCTIDKFFQQTLKAFSREIGQFASYQVELDKKSLVSESVDRVLDALTEDQQGLLSWLKESVMDGLEQGKKYNMVSNLQDVAFAVKSDQRKRLVEKYGIDESVTTSRDNLSRTASELKRQVSEYESAVSAAAASINEFLIENALTISDTKNVFSAGVSKILDWKKPNPLPVLSDAFVKNSGDFSLCFKKADLKKYSHLEDGLMPLVHNLVSLYDIHYKVYATSKDLLSRIKDFGIVAELNAAYDALVKEKNIMCLDDSNTILRDIIDGSDAPFIYEKLGVRYDHFLLDEFQDTSKVQWENFRPLVEESHSRGSENLLVGDVKQNIYRWRGSDWDLMAKDVPEQMPDLVEDQLDCNYRSLQNVVDFNNDFFKFCAESIDAGYEPSKGQIPIASLYADVHQQYKKGAPGEGYVEALFVGDRKQDDYVIQKVKEAKEAGAMNSDIAVLVRTNRQASEIASALLGADIPVISDEALKIKSSVTVRRLASLMSLVDAPNNTVGSFLANSLNMNYQPKGCLSLVDMAEGILRQLRDSSPDNFTSEIQYIQGFMDCLQDYVNTEGNDLAGFLKRWAEVDPSIGSPAGADAVRVMTIHKSKGLQFPYVIIPHLEDTTLYNDKTLKWCHADVEGTSLEGVVDDVYQVRLSSKSDSTLFENEHKREEYLQHIDAINTLYVALTRAEKCLCMISSGADGGKARLAQYMFIFLSRHPERFTCENEEDVYRFVCGQMYDFKSMKRDNGSDVEIWPCQYPSYPLNLEPEEMSEPGEDKSGRLRIKADSADFFAEDGSVGMDASIRLKGTTLHRILEDIRIPSDLESAVRGALARGEISLKESEEAYALLKEKIEFGRNYGFFPDDPTKVSNESTVVDVDGTMHRPDRVVFTDDGVIVIDYKFGHWNKENQDQISRYRDVYTRMGYKNVSVALWYVRRDKILQ